MFNFLTIEENFTTMAEVARQYQFVRERLLQEFWQGVIDSMKSLIKERALEYKVDLTGVNIKGISNKRTKILLYHKDVARGSDGIPMIAIAYERMAENNWPFWGLFLNNLSEEYDIEKMRQTAFEFHSLNFANEFNNDRDLWYPFWSEVDIDFSIDRDFLKILPENRAAFTNELASEAIDLALKCEPLMLKMLEMKK
jgi:hypothetical protein